MLLKSSLYLILEIYVFVILPLLIPAISVYVTFKAYSIGLW